MRRVLALDLGGHTGWAARGDGGVVMSGTADFTVSRHKDHGMAFLEFERWLEGKYQELEPECIYYESVARHLGTSAAHMYGGYWSHVVKFCKANGIPYKGVPVGTIKKHAAGSGNAKKDEMIAAMKSKGFDPRDDNEADAQALLMIAMEELG